MSDEQIEQELYFAVLNWITSAEVVDNELMNKKELVRCTIKIGNRMLLLGCIYRPNMHDDINEINTTISKAKKIIQSKTNYGLLICGDFDLPMIEWNTEGGTTKDSPDYNAQDFIDTLDDCFLTQFVVEPTFQTDDSSSKNILDLVISDCPKMPHFEMRTNETCKMPEISETLVFRNLINLEINKSVGVDGVSPHVLVKCASTLAIPLAF